MRKKRGPVRELASPESSQLACSRRLAGATSDHDRTFFRPVSECEPRQGLTGLETHSRRSTRSGAERVAGAALSQGQVYNVWRAPLSQGQVQSSWQGQHFRKVRRRMRGRRSTFARSGTLLARSTFARSGAECAARAALSQGQVQSSWIDT